ncbi:MAG: TetR/AcrR family transcriptional regulator [Thermoactinomyces sp.]
MNGFQLRREKKMEDILEAAFELFSANGIKNVSITEIAEKANVSRVSIYNFFGSKEKLVRQSCFYFMDKIMKDLQLLVKSDLSFQEKFEKMFSISIESANDISEDFYQSQFLKDPIVLEFLEEYKNNKSIPLLMDLIDQGKKEGYIDSELSSEAILLYINSINGVLQSNISKKARLDLGKLFSYGLFGERGGTHTP